jgi:hypothetical protein
MPHRLLLLFAASSIALLTATAAPPPRSTPATKLEIGIDRSNMSTEWSLSPPSEPNIYPFTSPYNGPGVFEARRVAIFDGIAAMHPQWFRDGFGADTPADAEMFVDTVQQIHKRGMKILAVVGPTGTDFDPKDRISPQESGCQWGTHKLSEIDLQLFSARVRTHFDALKKAGESVDAFEIGNELDLYCNDADMPKTSDFAKHNWQWFLTPEQVHAFAVGYAPFLKAFAGLIKEYFPHAKIITCGMSNPSGNSAPLIQAMANFKDASGKTFDYTTLVDGYGSHMYPPADTTLNMIAHTIADLSAQAATYPNSDSKPIWITEWNESGGAAWSSKKWFFQPSNRNGVAADLNSADAKHTYPPMTREEVIRAFREKVIESLRIGPKPANIATLFYYSYDASGKSGMCDASVFNTSRNIKGTCFTGLIDPVTGKALPDVVAALTKPQ